MKCNPLRWVWGLLPIALLSWGAVQMTHADIEADLKRRVDEQLGGSGFKWAKTGFSGRDGILSGTAADEADPGRAYDISRSIWGVRMVDNKATVIEKIENYQWSIARSGAKIRLAGFVPNEGVRAEILKQARTHFPGQEISDEMKLARGASDAWLNGVMFGMKQVAGLKTGEARLDGLALVVAGEAGDIKGYRAVKAALANDLPRGLRLQDDRVVAPTVKPFTWTAKHGGGQLLLSGYVPSERARAELLAAAKGAFQKATIVDKMEIAEGAAAGHMTAALGALKELARLEDGSAEITDHALLLRGLAADNEIAGLARQGIGRSLPADFKVSDAITARESGPKAISPYTMSVVADAQAVTLTGYAPTEVVRERFADLARQKFPGRRIDNRLTVAPGAPDGWQRCYDGGLVGLARVGGGKLAMTDRRLDVSGATDDEALAGALPEEIKAAVRNECEATVRIDVLAEAAPDLVWRASYDGSELIMDGDVASAAAKSGLVASAQRLFPGKNIVDRMRIVETRTRKWPLVAERGLVALAELQRGEATLIRQELVVSGQAVDAVTAARARANVGRDLATGFVAKDQIAVAAPPVPAAAAPSPPEPKPTPAVRLDPVAQACETTLRTTAREGMIRFERASAQLARESFSTLDKLAAVAKTCPNIIVEIEGHTDAEGTPERNQKLSDRRAQAIVDYLARTGVEPQRLAAVGYGETRPLVPNDTPENRAKNRRIEFTVKPR